MDRRSWKAKVYRLRGLPASVGSSGEAAKLLATAIQLDVAEVVICSLASDVDIYNNLSPKVATVMFKTSPELGQDIRNVDPAEEWCFEVDCAGQLYKVSIDTHFRGLTPLCDVEEGKHMVDCIAISGLSSHPFGSWTPPGNDKGFMWIRDRLPTAITGLRPILYGYNSDLNDGNSFQTLNDLATGLIGQIGSSGWKTSSGRQIIFLAHSLGGLVLKNAVLQLANSPNDFDQFILQKVIGVLLFGVPNRGMNQRAFLQVTEGQLNEHLIEDLGRYMPHLLAMDDRFQNIAVGKNISVFWFHEGRTSPITVRNENGQLSRGIEREILVTSRSATSAMLDKSPEKTFQVNETHSNMVRLSSTSEYLRVIFDRISTIMKIQNLNTQQAGIDERNIIQTAVVPTVLQISELESNPSTTSELQVLLDSLHAPDLRMRQHSIENRSGHTFDWIFDQAIFTEWLQDGSGMFWIKGKPASGKSTFMRFLYEDRRTKDFLNTFLHRHLIQAAFFFHYRGSALQKSFEGLLRAITHQLISKEPKLILLDEVKNCLPSKNELRNANKGPSYWTNRKLKTLLLCILGQRHIKLDICLFLDALDEFDGPPEVISRFLSHLVSTSTATGSPHSLRILTSSRPWSVFEAEFKNCKTITLHEHTRDDIRGFCEDRITAAPKNYRLIEELITQIVDKARGSFLWVKLLLDNMLLEQSPWCKTGGTASAAERLSSSKELLNLFPEELDDYYRETFLRMKPTHRYETYALFELLARDADGYLITARDVLGAVRCAQSHTWKEARSTIERMRAIHPESQVSTENALLETWSGGLVEVLQPDPKDNDYIRSPSFRRQGKVQLVHQTVFEFVTRVGFKELVLQGSAALHDGNGHSYLTKWRLARVSASDIYVMSHIQQAMLEARLSEQTTGKSQKDFVCSIPIDVLQRWCLSALEHSVGFGLDLVKWNSHFAFAVSAGLTILVRELYKLTMRREPHSGLEPCLLSGTAVFTETTRQAIPKSFISIATQLLNFGYDAGRERYLLAHLLTLNTDNPPLASHDEFFIGFITQLVKSHPALLSSSVELKDFRQGEYDKTIQPYQVRHVGADIKVSLLHLAWGPKKASMLLRCGADPNVLDSLGNTPLDVYLSEPDPIYTRWEISCYCVSAVALLEAGGRLKNTSRLEASQTLAIFEREFSQYSYPLPEGREPLQSESRNWFGERSVEDFGKKGTPASYRQSLSTLRRALAEYWHQEDVRREGKVLYSRDGNREGKRERFGRFLSLPWRLRSRNHHAQ